MSPTLHKSLSSGGVQNVACQEMIGSAVYGTKALLLTTFPCQKPSLHTDRRCSRCKIVCAAFVQDTFVVPGQRLGFDLLPYLAAALGGLPESVDRPTVKVRAPKTPADSPDPPYLEFPSRQEALSKEQKDPQLVRVRLSVPYRVHSRQMLCIGGSQIPFGWSFLSIAKVPMTWTEGDIWQAEFELPARSKIEYKYVILEEQDWTKQESEDAEGIVTFTYRTEPANPPDVKTIQKQMAIVAWQPGANRMVAIPAEEELSSLQAGEKREREPARPPQRSTASPLQQQQRQYGQQAVGQRPAAAPPSQPSRQQVDELAGTWETLQLDEDGMPLLERRDVWGFADKDSRNRGIRFDTDMSEA